MLSYVGTASCFLQQLDECAQKDRQSHQYTPIYVRKHRYEQFMHKKSGGV